MDVLNIVEKQVRNSLDSVMSTKPGLCRCEKCRADIVASALNYLKPKYVVTSKGETMAKAEYLETQLHLTVIIALTKAVEKVFAAPRHQG